jgi:hypothetical protein
MTKIINFVKSTFHNPISMFGLIVSLTVLIHWSLVQVYSTYCVQWGIFGLLQTFITLGSPMCQFANTVQYELGKHYITIWIGAGTACVTWLLGNFKKG